MAAPIDDATEEADRGLAFGLPCGCTCVAKRLFFSKVSILNRIANQQYVLATGRRSRASWLHHARYYRYFATLRSMSVLPSVVTLV